MERLRTLGAHVAEMDIDGTTWMPFADIADSGIPMAASSDHPRSVRAALLATRSGVNRVVPGGDTIDPDQSVPADEWLRAWTAGAAHAEL